MGDFYIAANNVTLKNVRITEPTTGDRHDWAILQWVGYSGLTVEDSTIIGNSTIELRDSVMDPGGFVTVLRCNISGQSKHAIQTTQGLIKDNYLHDPNYFSAADGEVDEVRIDGTPDSGQTLTIQHNTMINMLHPNGDISMFDADGGTPTSVTVTDNYLKSYGFAISADGTDAPTSYIVVTDNVFAKSFGDGYTYVTFWNPDGKGNVWSSNKWEDGKPAPAL